MGDKVLISYSKLGALVTNLSDIVEEFRNAGDRSSDIRSYMGHPYDKTDTTDVAVDTEKRWNTKRKQLADDLERIHDRAKAIHDEFQKYDTEAAQNFEQQQTA